MNCRLILASLAAVLALAGSSHAAPIYSNDFEVDTTASWTVNGGPADEAANFFYDYTAAGIPLAPNSTVGDNRGLNLQANMASGIFGGFSVSPTGVSAGPKTKLSFDWWGNVNGPFPVGGSGSTQLSTFGILTDGTSVQWPGGVQSSVWFAATGDGNSASDWRAYSSGAGASSYPDASSVYAAGAVAGNRNAGHAYYASLGTVSAPAAQLALYPQQTGTTLVGSAGMEWHQVVIESDATNVTWKVDGLLISTVPITGLTTSGSNVFFGHSDSNAGSSSDVNDVNLLFTLIDNVVVVPEPSSLVLSLVAALGGLVSRRRR